MFKKEKAPVEHSLYANMREALHQYSTTLQEYYQYLQMDENSGSPQAQLFAQKVEVARFNYYKLRIQYEHQQGDIKLFQSRLQRFFTWRREINLKCLVQRPYDQYTTKSALENATSLSQ